MFQYNSPELRVIRNDLNSFHNELLGIIRQLPPDDHEVGRREISLLNMNMREFLRLEREFQAAAQRAQQAAQVAQN